MHIKNNRNKVISLGIAFAAVIFCINGIALAQPAARSNPWASMEIREMPPIASLTDGVWLKGELHIHSNHSTDASNNPIAKIVEFSKAVGMDYLAITDHDNHVRGDVANHTWADPEFKSDSILMLYGAEWTTSRGHGNVFSATPYDNQRLYDVREQRDVVVEAIKKGLGVHLSANHPAGGNPWGYSYDMVESIEIWNSARWSKNANAVIIWDRILLSAGRMVTGRGGSDAHHGIPNTEKGEKETRNTMQVAYNYVGTPTTWVFATARTSQAVIDALNNGRVSVSLNPYAPRVEFYADLDQDGTMDMMMGDNAKSTGKPVKFRVQLAGNTVPGGTYTVSVVKNNRKFETFEISDGTAMVEFTDTPAALGRTYYRVEVQGPPTPYPEVPKSVEISDNMVGLSNPIYFNFDPNF